MLVTIAEACERINDRVKTRANSDDITTIVPPSVKLENEDVIVWDKVLPCLERVVRTCYKSEQHIKQGSDEKLIRQIVHDYNHLSTMEHAIVLSFRIVTSRAISMEAIRHRITELEPSTSALVNGSFDLKPSVSQESQRYVNYHNKGGYQAVYSKHLLNKTQAEQDDWFIGINNAFLHYDRAIKKGWKPEEARDFLPNSCRTELVLTFNLSALRHFFSLRTAKAAHPDMRIIANEALNLVKNKINVVFEDFKPLED